MLDYLEGSHGHFLERAFKFRKKRIIVETTQYQINPLLVPLMLQLQTNRIQATLLDPSISFLFLHIIHRVLRDKYFFKHRNIILSFLLAISDKKFCPIVKNYKGRPNKPTIFWLMTFASKWVESLRPAFTV